MEFPFHKKVFALDETIELAKEFSSKLKQGSIVVLNGNLGAGKTLFIKNTLRFLDINNVNSPTFALVNEYKGKLNKEKLKVYHFDFYRINNKFELYDIGFDDYLNDDEAVTFIEWGNLFPELLPSKRIEIEIEINEDFSREFDIKKYE